ncbi:hypothetical protein Hanom_Chr11g01020141 [Helianthus anomalus]
METPEQYVSLSVVPRCFRHRLGCDSGCFSGVAEFSIVLSVGVGDCKILFSRCITLLVCFTVLWISGSNTNGDDFSEFRV